MQDELDQDQIDQITQAIARGHKIQAVKIYKTAAGCDLRQAKQFVEGLTDRLVAEDPNRFEKPTTTVTLNLVAVGFALLVVGVALALFLGAG